MKKRFLHMNIVTRLIVFIGLPVLLVMSVWAWVNISFQNQELMAHTISDTERLTETIRLGTHYAMTLNSRDDITQIIQNIGKQQGIEKIHIYNKSGEITFSNAMSEVHQKTNIRDEACDICHKTDPPLVRVSLAQRMRIFESPGGYRLLGILTPIYNEKGCSTEACHFHPADKTILGALDVVVSLQKQDKAIRGAKIWSISLAALGFVVISAIIFLFVHWFINVPVSRLIQGTKRIAEGDFETKVTVGQEDEMGELARAVNQMGDRIKIQQAEINAQRDEYRTLFDDAPCMISVQDRGFRLLRYNRRFMDSFAPEPDVFCFQAYKGRDEKCDNCPVEKTFMDGKSHYSEESGTGEDGKPRYWISISSPIRNHQGEVVSAIEMSLDITSRKALEKQLEASEKKYWSIFNNIPNPVFVLDADSLAVIDCNQSVASVYGYVKADIISRPFHDLFIPEEQGRMGRILRSADILNRVRQVNRTGETLYVDIWISPSEYGDRQVLLVTTSDITQRLKTEQELIQAGKMATLGEMSTGIAHELNQPLSVIKTASDFILKKVRNKAPMDEAVQHKLLTKINTNVDRASKIIEHMRHFARKSDINFELIDVNEILKRAHDIFSQQLKVRGIEVVWELADDLGPVMADPGRVEQVFINLLVNARDAIEEKSEKTGTAVTGETITIQTLKQQDQVKARVSDTGIGIRDEIREKIFEPFFTTKEVGKGTGLGLSISYGIIKECKGDINVASDPLGGTSFTISFPAANQAMD